MTRVMISDSEQRCCRLYDCEAGMASVTVSTIARRLWELLCELCCGASSNWSQLYMLWRIKLVTALNVVARQIGDQS